MAALGTLLVLSALAAARPAHAAEQPSFDCGKAATPTERAICATDALALLDRDIASLYRQRRARSPIARAVDANQKQWLAVRDRCGQDSACLEKEMTERKQVLQELVARFANAPAKDKSGFSGAYASKYGTVEIEAVSPVEFDVSISTAEPTNGRWMCDFSGTGRLKNAAIVIEYRSEAAASHIVTLTRKGETLTVSDERIDQADYCGHNGYIEGSYRRKVSG